MLILSTYSKNRVYSSFTMFRSSHLRSYETVCPKYESVVNRHNSFLNLIKYHGDDNGKIIYEKKTYYSENINRKYHIGYITISNPLKRNAVTGKMMFELGKIVDSIFNPNIDNGDNTINGLVITGDSNYFCAGADLNLVESIINTPERGEMMARYMTDVLNSIYQSSIISVSILNGPALGGGAEIATSTDYRLIYHTSFIQFVHASIGATPGWGGIRRLLSFASRSDSLFVLATTKRILPDEAVKRCLADNIINTIVDPKECGTEFLNLFFKNSYPMSVNGIKEIISYQDKPMSHEDEKCIDNEIEVFKLRWGGVDNREAVDKFFRKHPKH